MGLGILQRGQLAKVKVISYMGREEYCKTPLWESWNLFIQINN